ncbi:MAG TPA: VOC family protein [Gemmatimonadaceae bacterium]
MSGTKRAEPESFRARSLQASLTVKDLPASVAWYQDVMGFMIDREHKRESKLIAVSLQAGTVRILLTQDDGAKGLDRDKGEGLSLMMTTAQNIDELANRIKASGGVLESDPFDTPWGMRAFRLRDPDGFKFVISSEG